MRRRLVPGPDPSGRAAVAASRGPFAAFSRAFRAAYGVSPSDYRAAAIGLHRPD
ncbi:hypothetical protein [Actinomadura xylanilytica]|uniref:hypothetical protein n=1 Tax=Actinomadura xylanilytica TaxID=887459 RepID=UPI00255AA2C5|nr:hypothetical protein [Actinomadura xylanilytica]MDL4772545.1 hypothetical protein [Actinomadura xylanilytica]